MTVKHCVVRFRSLLTVATAGLVFATAGCETTGTTLEPDPQPGIAEPEGEPDGGPEGEPDAGPEVGGESCAEAEEITSGTINGNTAGASDDHKGPCDTFSDEGATGPDLTYSFTLTERSSVTLAVSAAAETYDPILYLSSADSCTGDVACVDAIGQEENFAQNLDAGTYFVVVDTFISEADGFVDGGAFTLTLDIQAPQCFDDQFDEPPNDTPAGAPSLGGLDVDTLDLDPSTPEEDSINLFLCDAADYFLLPHMGGDLDVTVSSRDGGDAPAAALHIAEEDAEGGLVEGALVPFGNAGRGNYLLKITAGDAEPAAEGFNYRIVATHGCQPDESDAIELDQDDNTVATASAFTGNTEEPVPYNMCEGDEDGFLINSLIPGDVVLTFGGATGVTAVVSSVGDDDALTPAVENTDYTVAVAGDDYVVTLTNTGRYFVLLSAGTTTGSTPYTVAVDYAAFDGPAANDTCAANVALTPAPATETVASYTYNGTHAVSGPLLPVEDGDPVSCNGDAEVPAASETGPAAEVFYSFTLAAPTNVEFEFDGSASGFAGAIYVLEFTDNTCPADLSTLTPVAVDGTPVCETGVDARIRVTDMPAGDYLVVVDGLYFPETEFLGFVFPEETTEGAFELKTTTYPDGFPLPAACIDASSLAPPAAGSPATATVDRTDLTAELTGSCGGNGEEMIFELVADADADLVITAGGGEEDYDTVLYVLSGQCGEAGTEVACNDDDDNEPPVGNLGSRVDISVTAGTTYYIVVDAYSAAGDDADVSANLSVSIAE